MDFSTRSYEKELLDLDDVPVRCDPEKYVGTKYHSNT